MAEKLEPRVLYSADAVAALAPLLDANGLADDLAVEIPRLLTSVADRGQKVGPEALRGMLTSGLPDDIDLHDLWQREAGSHESIPPEAAEARTQAAVPSAEEPLALVPEPLPSVVQSEADLSSIGAGHVVFIDRAVAGVDDLEHRIDRTGATVVVIDADEDGLLAVSRALSGLSDLAAVHFFAHGDAGSLSLGRTTLDSDTLEANARGIARWGDALVAAGDVLIYGCNTAGDSDGLRLLEKLATLTGTDVAASDDLTGHAREGGDWELEYTHGVIDVASIDGDLVGDDWESVLGSITIVETSDGINAPAGLTVDQLKAWQEANTANRATLRDAIIAAGSDEDADTITLSTGTYLLDIPGIESESVAGDLDLRGTLTVLGDARDTTIIETGDIEARVLEVLAGSSVVLDSLTVTGGEIDRNGAGIMVRTGAALELADVEVSGNVSQRTGGGIYVESGATFDMVDSVVADNQSAANGGGLHAAGGARLAISTSTFADNSSGTDGGALSSASPVDLRDVSFLSNHADSRGGALHLRNGGGALEQVTLHANTASGDGGAIFFTSEASLALLNVTFSENVSATGGAIRTDGPVDILNSTFYQNRDSDRAGAISVFGDGFITLRNSVFDSNTSNGEPLHVSATNVQIESRGFNVFSHSAGIALLVSDREQIDPRLEPLTKATGFVATHRPALGSPLIDAGGTVTHTTDASGEVRRPGLPDIGAHEFLGRTDIVYYVDDDSSLYRVGADLLDPQRLIDDVDFLLDIAVDVAGGRLYWLNESGGRQQLGSADLDGGNRTTSDIIDLLGSDIAGRRDATSIAIDAIGGHLLIAATGAPANIYRFPLAAVTADNRTGIAGLLMQAPGDISVGGSGSSDDPVRVYWLEHGGFLLKQSISSIRVSGPDDEYEAHVVYEPEDGAELRQIDVSPDGDRFYYTDSGNDEVNYFELNSNTLTIVLSDPLTTPQAIATGNASDAVFFAGESGGPRHVRADDGLIAIESDVPVEHAIQASAAVTTVDNSEAPEVTAVSTLQVGDTGSRQLRLADLSASDDYATDRQLLWQVSAAPQVGVIELDGEVVDEFSEEALAAGRVVYRYTGDSAASDTDSLTLYVTDGTHETGPVVVDVTKTAGNSLPYLQVGVTRAFNVDEGQFAVIGADVIAATDDDGPADSLTYSLASPDWGKVHRVDSPTPLTQFTQADIDAGVLRYTHAGAEVDSDTLLLTVSDAQGGQFDTTVDVLVRTTNDAPTLTTGVAAGKDGESRVLTGEHLQASDEESGPDELTYSFVQSTNDGYLTVDGDRDVSSFTQQQLDDGLVRFQHSYTGNVEHDHFFDLTVTDGSGAQASGTLRLTVAPWDGGAPVAVADTIEVDEGGNTSQLADGSTSVLANDLDSEGGSDLLSAVLARDVEHGQLTLDANGAFKYAHGDNEETSDSFTYFARNDTNRDSEIVTVTIDIVPFNDAPTLDGAHVATPATEDVAYSESIPPDVWSDPDPGDSLVFVATRIDGSALPNWLSFDSPSLTFSGTPVNGNVGSIDVRVVATDTEGASADPLEFELEVVNVNDPPRAPVLLETEAGLYENDPGAIVGTLGAADDDVDDTIEFTVDDPRFETIGSQLRLRDGVALDAEAESSVTLVVTAVDAADARAEATFEIVVQDVFDAPVGEDDRAELSEGGVATELDSGATSVLENDDTGSGDASAVLHSAPVHGSVDLAPDGTFEYRHSGSETTSDSFRYVVRDSSGQESVPVTVTLDIEAVNSAPYAIGLDNTFVDENEPAASIGRLSAEDDDLADTLRFETSDGRFVVDGRELRLADGVSLDFEAEPSVPLVITAIDSAGARTDASFDITVRDVFDAPAGKSDRAELDEGGSTTRLDSGAMSVLDNDDKGSGGATVRLHAAPVHGTLTLADDGTFEYRHDGSQTTEDRFEYVVRDNSAQESEPVTVTLDIAPVNSAPYDIRLDNAEVEENHAGAPIGRLSAHDDDLQDTLRYETSDSRFVVTGDTLRLAEGVSLDAETEPSVALTVTAIDSGNEESDARFDILVRDVFDAPVARDDRAELFEGGITTVLDSGAETVLDNDDQGSGAAEVELHAAPLHGGLALNADGTFEYQHDSSQTTTDSFEYVIRDSSGQVSAPVTVQLAIEGVNTAPYDIRLDNREVEENRAGALIGRLSAKDEDAADTLRFETVDARFVIEGNELRLAGGVSLDAEDARPVTLTVAAIDSADARTEVVFDIRVQDVDDAPVAMDDRVMVAEGGVAGQLASGATSLLDNDDTGSGGAVVELHTAPLRGTLDLAPDGTFEYRHDGSQTMTDSFEYTVRDSSGQLSAPATVFVDIAPVNTAPFDIRLDNLQVGENLSGARIGQLSASDHDPNDSVRYETDDARFVIEGDVLRLADDRFLDFESLPTTPLLINAIDSAGAIGQERFVLQVQDGNDAPLVIGTINPPVLSVGSTFRIPDTVFSDADRDALTYTVVRADGGELPGWLVFDASTPGFSVVDDSAAETSSVASESRVSLRLFADDGRGGQASIDFDLAREPVVAAAQPEPIPEPPVPVPEPEPEPDPETETEPEPEPEIEPAPAPVSQTIPETIAKPVRTNVAAPLPAVESPAERPLAARVAATAPAEASADEPIVVAERVSLDFDTVDLQTLVDGVPTIGKHGRIDAEQSLLANERLIEIGNAVEDIDTVDLASLIGVADTSVQRGIDDLVDVLERQEAERDERASFAQTLVGGSVGITSGLSVGYLIWLVRGGTLMGSMLSSLPAWRFVDPLPVLGTLVDDVESDEESLQSMVDGPVSKSG